MLKSEAVIFFGTNVRIADIAGVDPSAVSQWREVVPERAAQRLAEASNGELSYDKDFYDQHRKNKRSKKTQDKPTTHNGTD